MGVFDDFDVASDWFHRHAGRVDSGPLTDGVHTFTLTVCGVTSSVLRYPSTDLDAYYRAFVEACNEIASRLGTLDP
jgi:hypothetical protein